MRCSNARDMILEENSQIISEDRFNMGISRNGEECINASDPAAALKHTRLMEVLCSPDETGESPLHIAGNELIGAGWRVPIVNGIPDFVTYAPKSKRSLAIEIPSDASPDAGILNPPKDCSAPPSWFQQAMFKFPLLHSHRKGFLLDVGAGQGNRRTFEGFGYDYISLDVSFNSRQTSQGDADIDIVADCHRLPIKTSCVEAVDCTAVIEHLYCPSIAVSEICRILKPGGLLVGSCSFLEAEHFDSQMHFSHLGLFRLLQYSGLKVICLFPGQSVWESHSGSIFLGFPGHKLLGRLHRQLYLSLVKLFGNENPEQRLLRHAATLNFAAIKPVTPYQPGLD